MKNSQAPILRRLLFALSIVCFVASSPILEAAVTNVLALAGSQQYRREALSLMMADANEAGTALHLQDRMPFKESTMASYFIEPIFFTWRKLGVGYLDTGKYTLYFGKGNQLWVIDSTHQEDDAPGIIAQYTWPIEKLDTNAAYNLAMDWLRAFHADVDRLRESSDVSIDHWVCAGKPEKMFFVPVYVFNWETKGTGEFAAKVSLLSPTRTLISLRIADRNYNLRPSLPFTNLDHYMSETFTNFDRGWKRTPKRAGS